MYDGVAVYRHYSKDAELLYVGQSADPDKRLKEHKRTSVWAGLVSNSRIIWFATRRQALNEETIAIIEEKPLHNRRIPRRQVVVNFDDIPSPGMESTTEIIAFVGLENASTRLGVDRDTIRRQAARPQLPAAWYDTLEQLAGRPLPRNLFTFKGSPK